jgi:NADPH:quinone reductase-like Zn-dependent oxidoreductase
VLALLPTGGPDLVSLGHAAEPSPAANEAVVAVEAFSLNRGELLLLERGRRRPGKDVAGVVVRAAADGSGPAVGERVVGHFLVELATGADVTVVSRRPERLLALGARAAVGDVAEAEGPFDVVLESVGGPSLETAMRKVAPGGLVLWFGQASRTPARLGVVAGWEHTSAVLADLRARRITGNAVLTITPETQT